MKRYQSSSPSPGSSRRWQIASALALAAGGWFWLCQPSEKIAVSSSESGPKITDRSLAREAEALNANASLLARFAEKGKNAIPLSAADPNGPPVPAIVPERALIGSGWASDPEPALADFAQWVNEYLALPDRDRSALEQRGIEMATARREALALQIVSNPRRALGNAIPLAIRDQLPPSIQALLEDRVNGFGDLALFYGLPAEGKAPAPPADRARVDGVHYEAYRYGGRSSVPYINEVSLHGVAIDGKLAVLDSPVRMLEQGESLEGEIVNETCPVSGETVAQAGSGIASHPETMFQLGEKYFEVCEPPHVVNVESSIVTMENNAENTASMLDKLGLHPLCIPRQPMALGDSGVAGTTGYAGRPPSSLTHGGKNILVMRVQPTDKPYPTDVNESYFNSLIWASGIGWNDWIKRISYNKTWISNAHVTPVMNLPQNSAYYTGNGYDWWRWLDDSKAAAAAHGYTLANYSCFVVAHDNYSGFAPAWGGSGAIWCNGAFDTRIMVHEYGHVFWLPHANSWHSTDGDPMSPTRQHIEYGDHNDVMGGGWLVSPHTSFNAYFKNLCGWLPDSAVQNVTRSGTYRVYQDDGATDLNRTLALKVGRDAEYHYWLSICGEPINMTNFVNGVAIRAVSSWRQSDTHLVDINEPGDTYRDDAPLMVGQTWYDAAADLTIKTVAVGGTNPNRYADVEITIGPQNTAAYRPLVHGGVYRLRNRHFGYYLQVPGNSSANGVELQGGAASGNSSENWVVFRHSDGSYGFNHQGTDKWIDVESNSHANGAKLWQYTGNGSDAQKWYVSQIPDGHIFLFHKGAGDKIMEMDSNHQKIHQMLFTGYSHQQWYPEMVSIVAPGPYRILSRNLQGQSLEIQGGGGANGTIARNALWGGFANQKWSLEDAGGGYLRLTPNSNFAQALDVNQSGTADGTRIQQWGWNASNAQKWLFSRTDGHWLRFTPACAPASSMDAGGLNLVHLWGSHSGYHQQWRFVDSDN